MPPLPQMASWRISVIPDAHLPAPTHPYYQATPIFHGATCCLDAPGFHGTIDPTQQRACLHIHPHATPADIRYFRRVVAAIALFCQGGILVHAAGVLTSAGALLFVGHSGSGKSTIAAHAAGRPVLHDDLIVIRPATKGWLASGLPGEESAITVAYPLAALLLLAHAPQNYLTCVRPAVALAELVANSPVINAAPKYLPRLFSFWRSLLAAVPIQRLHFRPSVSFWEVLDAPVR